jgi:hypothetical protein
VATDERLAEHEKKYGDGQNAEAVKLLAQARALNDQLNERIWPICRFESEAKKTELPAGLQSATFAKKVEWYRQHQSEQEALYEQALAAENPLIDTTVKLVQVKLALEEIETGVNQWGFFQAQRNHLEGNRYRYPDSLRQQLFESRRELETAFEKILTPEEIRVWKAGSRAELAKAAEECGEPKGGDQLTWSRYSRWNKAEFTVAGVVLVLTISAMLIYYWPA